MNRYIYVENNPMNFIDPIGLDVEIWLSEADITGLNWTGFLHAYLYWPDAPTEEMLFLGQTASCGGEHKKKENWHHPGSPGFRRHYLVKEKHRISLSYDDSKKVMEYMAIHCNQYCWPLDDCHDKVERALREVDVLMPRDIHRNVIFSSYNGPHTDIFERYSDLPPRIPMPPIYEQYKDEYGMTQIPLSRN